MKTNDLVKESMEQSLIIMVKNLYRCPSNEEAWNKSKAMIMSEVGMTEKGAVMMMRAVMSIVNNELHPMFQ